MRAARVIGQVVSTVKDPKLTGIKLLVIELLDGAPATLVAADATGQAGTGDAVYIMESKEAGMLFSPALPADASICGFIDEYPGAYAHGGRL